MSSATSFPMHELVEKLRKVLDDARPASPLNKDKIQAFLSGALAVYQLDPHWEVEGREAVSALEEAVDICLRMPDISKTATRTNVETVIREETAKALEQKLSAHALANTILGILTAGRRRVKVLFGLRNLVVETEIAIGPVRFLPSGHPDVASRRNACNAAQPPQHWQSLLTDLFQAPGFAEAQIEAFEESEKASAAWYVEEALSYLRSYYAWKYGNWDFARFGTWGISIPSHEVSLAFDHSGHPLRWQWERPRVVPAKITSDDAEAMRKLWGLDAISEVLKVPRWQRSDPQNDLRCRLAHAILWSGRACLETYAAWRAADYATAIDALALRKANAQEFGRRLAWLIEQWCHRRGTFIRKISRHQCIRDRCDLSCWAERFYREVRNSVVHDGRLRIDPQWERELALWRNWALMAIAEVAAMMADNGWTSFGELEAALQHS